MVNLVGPYKSALKALFTMTDVTATRNKHVHFSTKLHEVAANHSAGIGVGVVDQLWRHCLLLFLRVSVNN